MTSLTLSSGSSPGGAEAFSITTPPTAVTALSNVKVQVSFTPTALEEYSAVLTVKSDDPEHPSILVPLVGNGAKPIIAVTPECDVNRGCTGSVVVSPPSLDFGAQPYMGQLIPDPTTLPQVDIVNEGPVGLKLLGIALIGNKGNLRQDRRHIRPDQHDERSLLHAAVLQSFVAVRQSAVEALLDIRGKLAGFLDLVL